MQKKIVIPKTIDTIIVGILFLLFLFRYNLGIDFNIYYGSFMGITDPIQDAFAFHMYRNVGFNFVVYFCKVLFKEYRYFVLVSNLILLLLCGYPIVKYSKNMVLSALIFVGSGVLEIYYGSGLRQMFAMAIFFFAYYVFLQHKRYIAYVIMCVVGLTFHETILPLIFLPFLYERLDYIKANQTKMMAISFGVAIVILLFTSIILPPFARAILPTLPPIWHMLYYFAEGNQISLIGLAMEMVFLGLILWLYLCSSKDSDFDYFGVIVIWLSIMVYVAFCTHSVTSRVSDFIQIIFLILIPNLFESIPSFNKKLISLFMIVCLNGYLLHADLTYKIKRMEDTFHFGFGYKDYPYVTVFEKDKCEYFIEKVLDE